MDEAGTSRHRGSRAIQRMVEFAPATGGLALWVRHHDLDERAQVLVGADIGSAAKRPPVATDGSTLLYRASFERLPLPEQTGWVAHEVLHIALRHAQRFLELRRLLVDVDLPLFTICADAIVNSTLAHITWLELPDCSVFLEQLLSRALHLDQDGEKSLLEWDVERLYRAIDDRTVSGAASGQRDKGHPSGGVGTHRRGGGQSQMREDGPRSAMVRAMGSEHLYDLVPNADLEEAPEAEAEAVLLWSERILRAHAGDGEHSMLRTLLADVARHRTPWEQVLRTLLARSLAPQLDISWSRPSRSYIANQGRAGPHRRLPWTPSFRSSKIILKLIVIVDVSGSIPDALMRRFANEIDAITRRARAALVLIIGDDRVRRVQHFDPGCVMRGGPAMRGPAMRGPAHLSEIEFTGGGGTDFTPLLEEADAHRPDVAIVLTDLDGPARYRPRWPVIWAVPEEHGRHRLPPFGRKLSLN